MRLLLRPILWPILFNFLFLNSTSPWQNAKPIFHIWNIGQGQWMSLEYDQTCEHYDMGGERAPWAKILTRCKSKNNLLFLSHWDWDHLSFVRRFQQKVMQFCLTEIPDGQASLFKKKQLQHMPICSTQSQSLAKKIFRGSPAPNAKSNERSDVLQSQEFLVPGDSTVAQEKKWLQHLPTEKIQFLLLGHHGSKTSTSKKLLQSLPNLKMAFSSSRKKKYGHPHPLVLENLKRFRIPLLTTEEWGDIHIETRIENDVGTNDDKGDTQDLNRGPQAHSTHSRRKHSGP